MGIVDTLKDGLSKTKAGIKSALDQGSAAVDITKAGVKTVFKRATGDDSPTPLKPQTKQTLGIK